MAADFFAVDFADLAGFAGADPFAVDPLFFAGAFLAAAFFVGAAFGAGVDFFVTGSALFAVALGGVAFFAADLVGALFFAGTFLASDFFTLADSLVAVVDFFVLPTDSPLVEAAFFGVALAVLVAFLAAAGVAVFRVGDTDYLSLESGDWGFER